jgi:hypothetical protein
LTKHTMRTSLLKSGLCEVDMKEYFLDLMQDEGIISIDRCECGAVIFNTASGVYSVHYRNIKRLLPSFAGITKYPSLIQNRYGGCDRCINDWGLDLCRCGSGEVYWKCCKKPMQRWNSYTHVKASDSWI